MEFIFWLFSFVGVVSLLIFICSFTRVKAYIWSVYIQWYWPRFIENVNEHRCLEFNYYQSSIPEVIGNRIIWKDTINCFLNVFALSDSQIDKINIG